MLSSSPAESAIQTRLLFFPLYRGCDEFNVIWTSDPSAARETAAGSSEPSSFKAFPNRHSIEQYAETLGRAIVQGGDPFPQDCEFLASIGIALPAGPSYDPVDFPLASEGYVHPAVAATRAVRALGKPYREELWTAVLSGPNTITIHPPVSLATGQIDEAKERLQSDFPGARVRSVLLSGVTMFVVFFPVEAPVAA